MESDTQNENEPADLLEQVVDFESFLRFAKALATDREVVEALMKEEPERHKYGSPNGWQNHEISTFLRAAIAYAESPGETVDDSPEGSWADLATFLYLGKVYE